MLAALPPGYPAAPETHLQHRAWAATHMETALGLCMGAAAEKFGALEVLLLRCAV